VTAPNLTALTSVTAESDQWAATNTITTRITVASNTAVIVKAIRATNIHAATAGWITAIVDRSGTDYRIAYQVTIPINAQIEVLEKLLVLEEGDLLQLQANASSNVETEVSYFILT